MTRRAPRQKPGRSEQSVQTPPDLLAAVRRRFLSLAWDLAADKRNSVTGGAYFGPGSERGEDALAVDWPRDYGWCWLNPPYSDIGPWAKKCAEQSEGGHTRVLMLVPASVGSDWFNLWVRPYAYVLELTPRVKFVGHPTAYPKDLILCAYGPERLVGRRMWRWKESRGRNEPDREEKP